MWLLGGVAPGDMCGCSWGVHGCLGGMCGCSQGGACMVAPGGCACQGGMHGKRDGMHGEGGVCGKGGVCMAKGGVHGEGGACMAKGACVVKGGRCAWYAASPPEIRPVIARAVRILLECILVLISIRVFMRFPHLEPKNVLSSLLERLACFVNEIFLCYDLFKSDCEKKQRKNRVVPCTTVYFIPDLRLP